MAQVNVRNRKRKDGSNSWEYRFEIASVGGKRKRISKMGFRTKTEALNAGLKALDEYNNSGATFKQSEISVSDFLDLYIKDYCEIELAPETVEGYKKVARLYIKPQIGKYKLCSLSPLVITELFNSMKKDGYARSSLIKVNTVLSGALNYAVAPLQYLSNSPMIYVKVPKEAVNQTKKSESDIELRIDGKKNGAIRGSNPHVYIPKDKIDAIFDRFPKGHPSYIPLITGYYLGTRLGEAFALTLDDFDFENNTVNICKQVQWIAKKKCWYMKSPKYDSRRVISMPKEYADIVREKFEQVEKDKMYYEDLYTRYYLNEDNEINTDGDGREITLLNIRPDGTYIQPRTLQHTSYVIHNELNYPEFDFHSLRHTHATDLAKAGANPKFVQHRLGHKTIKVTLEIYQHIDAEMERKEADVFNSMY